MFCLFLFVIIPALGHEIQCFTLPRCEEYIPSVNTVNPCLSEGVGEIVTLAESIPVTGCATVDGSVPVAGSVTFGGEVHGSGTVRIVANSRPPAKPKCKKSKSPKTVRFLTPYSRRGRMPMIYMPAKTFPLPPVIPAKSQTVRQGIPASPPCVPTSPNFEADSLSAFPLGELPSCNNIVCDDLLLDAALPKEDFALAYVPAKGSVLITCKSF